MSDLLFFLKTIDESHPDLITWSGLALLILLALFLHRNELKEAFAEWKLNKLIKNIGKESLHNIVIPDEVDGNIFIENLILMPTEIIVLSVKRYRGLIFAAEKIDIWTQVIGNKSYKFENPLHHIEANIIAVKNLVENVEMGKKVLFLQGSEFPKGKPDNVVSIDDIKKWKREELKEKVPAALQHDWASLSELAVADEISTEKNIMKSLRTHLFSFAGFSIAILCWLYLRTL